MNQYDSKISEERAVEIVLFYTPTMDDQSVETLPGRDTEFLFQTHWISRNQFWATKRMKRSASVVEEKQWYCAH